MNEPSIYSLMQVPVIGELGEATQYREVKDCFVEPARREMIAFEYRFDQWDGEDIVQSVGRYAVSDREGPEIWATSQPCAGYGRKIWKGTDVALDVITATPAGRPAPTRDVYRDSWKGDDLFQLPDHILAVVTQRFVDVLDRLQVKSVHLQPARWVDR